MISRILLAATIALLIICAYLSTANTQLKTKNRIQEQQFEALASEANKLLNYCKKIELKLHKTQQEQRTASK